jgi:hypothetical protein
LFQEVREDSVKGIVACLCHIVAIRVQEVDCSKQAGMMVAGAEDLLDAGDYAGLAVGSLVPICGECPASE